MFETSSTKNDSVGTSVLETEVVSTPFESTLTTVDCNTNGFELQ